MSAALELAERGYDVTIREQSGQLGGRIQTYKVEKLNRTFHIDASGGHLCKDNLRINVTICVYCT